MKRKKLSKLSPKLHKSASTRKYTSDFMYGFGPLRSWSKSARTVELDFHPNLKGLEFAFNDDFSDQNIRTIEKAISIIYDVLTEHYEQREAGNQVSDFMENTGRYADKDWYGEVDGGLGTERVNAYWTVTWVKILFFINHATHTRRYGEPWEDWNGPHLPIIIDAFNEDALRWGNADINPATRPSNPDGSFFPPAEIRLNRFKLDKYPEAYESWAGVIYHEFLHNTGLEHPSGYDGSLIQEAGLCIKRKGQPKEDGVELLDGELYPCG